MSYLVRALACAISILLVLSLASPAPAQDESVIRLGIGPSDAFSEGYYAQEMGFFKRAGLRVEISKFRTGATIATGMEAGSIDIGISNVAVLAQKITQGTPLVVIAGGGLYTPKTAISALCVANGSPIRKPSDFIGKTIAVVALNDQSYLGTLAWLDVNHVDASKVRFIALPFNDMAPGIQNGLADGALLTEPWLSAALHGGQFRIAAKPYDVVAPRFLIGVWFTSRAWYAAHPDLAKRFVSVIYQTARWANAHQDQTAVLLADVSKIDLQTIMGMTRTPYPTSLEPALLQPQLDLVYKYHMIDRALNASDIIAR